MIDVMDDPSERIKDVYIYRAQVEPDGDGTRIVLLFHNRFLTDYVSRIDAA